MRATVLMLFLLASQDAGSLELLCKGKAYFGGQEADLSFVFQRNDKTGQSLAWTPEGEGRGETTADLKDYRGTLATAKGSTYTLVLDRYDGQMLIMRLAPPPPDSKVSFWGYCEKASRKF